MISRENILLTILIGLLLVVEKPLDAIRTAVNVEGDMIGGLVVQKVVESDANQN